MTPQFSGFLNLSRWTAAALVVIAHARHLLFVDYKLVVSPNLGLKGLYFITGLGHEAVVIFFVISGFLVGGITLQKWRTKGAQLGEYAVARTSRIYTVLIPGLLLGALLDLIGWHFFNQSTLYTAAEKYQSSMTATVSENLGLSTLVGNLLMLQGIVVPRLGSNAPLWSLANEWWYYVIFALVAAGLLAKDAKPRYALLVLALVIAALLPLRLVLWMSVWCLGIGVAYWIERGRRFPPFWLGIIVFGAALVAARLSHNVEGESQGGSVFTGLGYDLMLGIAYAFCLATASARKEGSRLTHRIHHHLAEFSYSTYLIHFPVMLLIAAAAYSSGMVGIQVQPTAGGLVFLAVWVAAVYACCYGFFWMFERHTDTVRRALGAALLNRIRPNAAASDSH